MTGAEPLTWRFYAAAGVLFGAGTWVLGDLGHGFGSLLYGVLFSTFLVALGAACLWNASRCGAVHCRVSGMLYLVLAPLPVVAASSIFPLAMEVVWVLFGIAALSAMGVEAWEGRHGSTDPT